MSSSKHLTRALLRSTTALALITWLASSCGTADGSDSLGSNELATIDTHPSVRLEATDGLFQVAGGLLIGDRAVLAERSTGTLRFYDGGELVQTAGGTGDGPGEFRYLSWVQASDGKLYAYDAMRQRVSAWSMTGEFFTSVAITLPDSSSQAIALGVFEDGSLLIGAIKRGSRPPIPTARRETLALYRSDSAGHPQDSLTAFLNREMFVEPFGRAGQLSSPLVFGRQGAVAVGRNRYYLIENDIAAIESGLGNHDATDTLRVPPFQGYGREAVTPEHIAIARERFVQDETPELPLGPVFDKMPIPDSFPPFGWAGEAPATTLRVHSDGSVWVMRFGGVRTTTPVWAVFDSTGKFRGNVAGPYEMDVLDSSGERVLVLTRSDLGEEFVDVREVHW